MLAVVKRVYRDRYSNKVMKIGDTVDISKKRFHELVKAGDFVEEVISMPVDDAIGIEILEELNNGELED